MSGALADMRRRGVAAVHASSVDNALVRGRQDVAEIAISEIAVSEITISEIAVSGDHYLRRSLSPEIICAGDRYLRRLCAVDNALVRERDIRRSLSPRSLSPRSLSPEITISGDGAPSTARRCANETGLKRGTPGRGRRWLEKLSCASPETVVPGGARSVRRDLARRTSRETEIS